MTARDWLGVVKRTFSEWSDDRAPRLGAALAYYAIFSIAPLVIIAAAISSLIFGEQAAQGRVVAQIQDAVGRPAAEAIQAMIRRTHLSGGSWLATVVGVVTLLFGALGVFVQLQDALNTIWHVQAKAGRGVRGILADRLLSFVMVLGVGLLLLAALAASAVLSALRAYSDRLLAGHNLPGGVYLWQGANALVSFLVITLLFALTYKVLPDVKLSWRDVGTGALVTAVLFTAGKFLIGLYLAKAGVSSAFGAAGSLVLVLVWVYYSAQVFLLGAEFTRVYADCCGRRIPVADNAEPVTPETRARQGMAG